MAHLIMESDSAFFYRQPAWHNLGIVSNELIQPATLYQTYGYEVIKEPLITVRGEQTGTYATIRTEYDADGNETKRHILGDKLGAGYVVVQNRALIDSIAPLMDAGCIIETALTLQNGKRFVILLRLPGDMEISNGELIKRFIMLANDHSGTEAAKVGFVPIRVVCANTLSLAETSGQSQLIRVRHSGDVTVTLADVVNIIDTANGQFLAYGAQLERLLGHGINQTELDAYVKQVFMPAFKSEAELGADATSIQLEAARKEADRLLKLQNAINEIFQTEDSIIDVAGVNGTIAGAYQSVNFYLNHVQNIGTERRLTNLAFGVGRQTDRRALNIALELVGATS